MPRAASRDGCRAPGRWWAAAGVAPRACPPARLALAPTAVERRARLGGGGRRPPRPRLAAPAPGLRPARHPVRLEFRRAGPARPRGADVRGGGVVSPQRTPRPHRKQPQYAGAPDDPAPPDPEERRGRHRGLSRRSADQAGGRGLAETVWELLERPLHLEDERSGSRARSEERRVGKERRCTW